MKAGVSEGARTRTIGLIRQAVAMPQWRLQHGGSYLVTGEPVIVSDLNGSITRSIELLLVAVVLVMAGTLALVFSGRPRLLPLGVALLAAALTFGALSVVGASLTMASIAVLPVLVGLAVDYAIQFQSRVEEADALADGATDRSALIGRTAAARRSHARHGRRGERGSDTRAGALAGADGPRLRGAAGGGRRHRPPVRASPRAPRRWLSPRRAGEARFAPPRSAGAPAWAAWRGARELLLDNPAQSSWS